MQKAYNDNTYLMAGVTMQRMFLLAKNVSFVMPASSVPRKRLFTSTIVNRRNFSLETNTAIVLIFL